MLCCAARHVSAHLAAFRGRCMLSHVDSTSDSESSRSAATGATGTVR
jgi:hypothetical protein